MNLLKNNDLIWEEKGIVIGIINFLLNSIHKIKRVYIEDQFYYKIIKFLFPVLKVRDKFNDDDKRGINICIKTISNGKDGYLILNNINNINKIKTKKRNFFLLPWFNSHNPIIMFKYDDTMKEMNINKIKMRVVKFNKKRLLNIINGQLPLFTYRCGILFWDIFIEYYILKKYAIFFNIDVNSISDYLYRKINSFNCSSYIQQKIIPIYIPYIDVKKQYHAIKKCDILNDIQIKNKKDDRTHAKGDIQIHDFLSKFMNTANNKISIMNNILYQNLKNI